MNRLPCEQILGASQPLGEMTLAPSSVNALGVNVLEMPGIRKCHLVTKEKSALGLRNIAEVLCKLRA